MGWQQWEADRYRRRLDQIMQRAGYAHDATILDWSGVAVRYRRGNVGVEIGSNAESNNAVEVWLRRIESVDAGECKRTWTPEDISLNKFCERQGLGVVPTAPPMGNAVELENRLDGAIEQFMPFILKAVDVVNGLPEL